MSPAERRSTWPSWILRCVAAAIAATGATSCGGDIPGDPLTMEPVLKRDDLAYLGGRPFVVSADGRRLAYAVSLDSAARTSPATTLALRRLEAVRILDLDSGRARRAAVGPTARRLLSSGHGPVSHLFCWDRSASVLFMPTTGRRWLEMSVRGGRPVWRASSTRRPATRCPDREVPRPPVRAGRYLVVSGNGGGLRVVAIRTGGTVFATRPPALREHRLSQVAASPDGRCLALVFSSAFGAFSGRTHGVVVLPRGDYGFDAYRLRPNPLYLQWHPGRRAVLAFARRGSESRSGIFHSRLPGGTDRRCRAAFP